MTFSPNIVDVSILKVETINENGETITIYDTKTKLQSDISIRYDNVIQQYIDVEIECDPVFAKDDMHAMDISIGTTTYKKSGRFISKSESIDFNEYIVPSFDIENIEDTIASVILGIETFDKYGNTVYKYFLPISGSDDGYIYERVEKSGQHKTQYKPYGDVYLIVHASKVNLGEQEQTMSVSVPDGYFGYLMYKPEHLKSGVFTKISEDIFINSDWQIKLANYNCQHIEYRYIIDLFNPEITSINSTPIIKRLAIIQAEL